MALNCFKCNYLTSLHFKGLSIREIPTFNGTQTLVAFMSKSGAGLINHTLPWTSIIMQLGQLQLGYLNC